MKTLRELAERTRGRKGEQPMNILSEATERLIIEEKGLMEKGKEFFDAKPDLEVLSYYLLNAEMAHFLKTSYKEMTLKAIRFYEKALDLNQYLKRINYKEGENDEEREKRLIEEFINTLLGIWLHNGVMIPSEKIDELRGMAKKEYAQQFKIFKEARNSQAEEISLEPLKSEMRKTLESYEVIKFYLELLYGGVDYKKTFIVESMLAIPSLRQSLWLGTVDGEILKKDQLYLADVLRFAEDFDPEQRISNLRTVAAELGMEVQWVSPKPKKQKMDEFDRSFIDKLARTADNPVLDKIYEIFKQTRLRRGRFFKIAITKKEALTLAAGGVEEIRREYCIKPWNIGKSLFSEVGGYRHQKTFFINLLEHVKSRDSVLEKFNSVLLVGVPGVGKTKTVESFLGDLPSNARAVKISGDDIDIDMGLDYVRELARAHPDLYIFGIAEDIDTVARSRDKSIGNRFLGSLLALDSVDAEAALPVNSSLVATTNRPADIDPAVIRPGRTTMILFYELPNKEERLEIIEIHSKKEEVSLTLNEFEQKKLVETTEKLTGDEIRHIFWSLNFKGKKSVTLQDIEAEITEVEKIRQVKELKLYGQYA